MIATISPGSIPEFVHPPVPGESHELYGDNHLDSIKLPASVTIPNSNNSEGSFSTHFLDPLAGAVIINNDSNTGNNRNRGDSLHEITSGANLTEEVQHEDSSDDILWARLVDGCINGQSELVQDLLIQSPKLKDSIDNISSATGMNPLHFAASRGHEEIVRILIDQAGAGVDIQDREGETALLKSSYSGYYPVVCFLLKRGANVHQRDKDGWSALHNASSKGFIEIAQALLEKGEADVNARSKMGHTPLKEHPVDHSYEPLAIHSTILMTVHENQRATSSFPLSLMAPKFSNSALTQQDVCGPWSLPNGRPSTKDDVHLPLVANVGSSNSRQRGWFWLTEWVIDKTDPNVDSDGWQYGKSFTEVNQLWSSIPPTSGSNWVRRRKWIRVMKKRVDLLGNPGDILGAHDEVSNQFYQELAGNYVRRSSLALRLEEGFSDTAQELSRYRQAIQILLDGIKVDTDVASKQSASGLVGEYLQRAEELAELIEQQNIDYARYNQLETPRPQLASRSSDTSIGSNNELRSLTLQKSRPSDVDSVEVEIGIHSQNGVDEDDTSEVSSERSLPLAANTTNTHRDLEDVDDVLQEFGVPGIEQEQGQTVHQPTESDDIDNEQELATVFDTSSLQSSHEHDETADNAIASIQIPDLTSGPHQHVPEVSVTNSSPGVLPQNPFPMTRLTRSPRPTTPQSSSSSSTTQLSSAFSSTALEHIDTSSSSQALSSNARPDRDMPSQVDSNLESHSQPSEFPRQFSSSFPGPTAFTSHDRTRATRVQSMQTPPPQQQYQHHNHSQSHGQIQTQVPVTEAKWESDHKAIECRECHRKFSLWLRRHHCRRCGHVVCDRCSSHRAMLHPTMVVYDPTSSEAYLNHQMLLRRGTVQSYRVCESCYATSLPPRSQSSVSGSTSGAGQSSTGSQQQYYRVYNGQTSSQTMHHGYINASHNDNNYGVYLHSSGYAPDLTSHSSSRSSSSSNLQSVPMVRNASSSSLMSECPVCGAVLAGLEGGKQAQEAHVQECLEGKSGQGSGPVRYVVYKLPADSPLIDQECAICFEEFVAGDELLLGLTASAPTTDIVSIAGYNMETLVQYITAKLLNNPELTKNVKIPSQPLDYKSFVALMTRNHKGSETSDEAYGALFTAINKDGSGNISAAELRSGLQQFGNNSLSETDIDEIVHEADVSGDGRITLEEFLKIMQKSEKKLRGEHVLTKNISIPAMAQLNTEFTNKLDLFRHLIGQNSPVLEWKYEQRREMQEILPSIFLGPHSATRNLDELKSAGITHIISLWDQSESKILKVHHPDQFTYLQLNISDAATQNLITLFPSVKQFIDQAILNENGKVLVSCMSGISRSPAFVVAYLMEATSMDYEVVYRYVQTKRFCMNPNPGFRHQLEEYGPIYSAIQAIKSQPIESRSSVRRSAPEDDDSDEFERQAPRLR
ncbi:hypothetical protein BGZ76_007063 [Entomortierella beljakovae]|nr:hypothetical protein BGZ76_007063 [Entomortierella beljakovae]